jgi:hypothetical protein
VWILLLTLALPLGGASDGTLDRATMRGVPSLNVVIDPIAPELEKEGTTADELRSRLEDRLHDAGIKYDAASKEFVAFRLHSVRVARGPFAIAATIAVYQPVTLVRDAKMRTSTQTWEVGTVVLVDAKQVHRACLDSVDELAERFVAAYRSVNPAAAEPAK